MKILNYDISTQLPLSFYNNKKVVINTINPHSYCVAQKDGQFRTALKESDYLVPDGIGIVWAAKFLKGKKISKIAGADVHCRLLEEANKRGLKVFYLGAARATLELIKERIVREYPNVEVGLYSPPYKPEFTSEDSATMVSKVNEFKPDVLFVGMTAPKQEKWVYAHKDVLNAQVITSIGAVFDFYAGTVKRPSEFWINIGLEWLPRFLKEPKRLAERNLVSTPKFILDVLKHKIK